MLAGCKSGAARKSGPKTKPARSAGIARADTMMRNAVDSELAREARNERPSAGKKTWREYWEWRISLWRKEKNKKYEQYFAQRRKTLGLPSVRHL